MQQFLEPKHRQLEIPPLHETTQRHWYKLTSLKPASDSVLSGFQTGQHIPGVSKQAIVAATVGHCKLQLLYTGGLGGPGML